MMWCIKLIGFVRSAQMGNDRALNAFGFGARLTIINGEAEFQALKVIKGLFQCVRHVEVWRSFYSLH